MNSRMETAIYTAAIILVCLFLFKNYLIPTQEPITNEITEYDVTNYINNLNNQYEKVNNHAVDLQGELDYLETTDLVMENKRLKGRVHPISFIIVFFIMCGLMGLSIWLGMDRLDKKMEIKRLIKEKETIRKIIKTKSKNKIKNITEIVDEDYGW